MFEIAPLLPLTRPQLRTRTMQAMLWQAYGSAVPASIPVPEPKAGELLIRAHGYGLSLHDIDRWKPRQQLRPGAPPAEGWGIVERIGRGTEGFEPGQPVAFITSRGFGECAIANAAYALPLPQELQAHPVLLRTLAGVVSLFRRSHINSGEIVTLVGSGALGLLSTQLIALAKAHTIVITRREIHRTLALSLGADATLSAACCSATTLSEITGGSLSDHTVEAAGTTPALQLAAEVTRPRGRLIIAGEHPVAQRVDLPLWHRRGIDIINAHEPSPMLLRECMQEAVGAVRAGLITPERVITHRYPLHRLNDAIQHAALRAEGFVKAIIHTLPCPTPPPAAGIDPARS